MRHVPPPKSATRALLSGLGLTAIEALAGVILLFAMGSPILPPEISGVSTSLAFASLITLTLALTAIVTLNRRPKYSYDEGGVYKGNRLLFDWFHVNKVTMSFKESSGSVNLLAGTSFRATVTGGPFQRSTYVSYGTTISFVLTDGSTVSIPTDLDRMSREGLVEDIRRVSRAANTRVQFE